MVRDPVFWLGGVLLILMLAQWLNSGRELALDTTQARWYYAPPPIAWLPSSVDAGDAAEMLRWFFPAWCVLLCCRICVRRGRDARWMLRLAVINAAVLALLTVGQYVIAVTWGFCEQPRNSYCVTSFGYANHAAAFFVLVLFLALGATFREAGYTRGRHWTGRLVLLACCAGALLVGALVTRSRTGIIMAGAAVVAAGLYSIFGGGLRVTLLERFNRSVAMAGVAIAVFWITGTLAGDDILGELRVGRPADTGTEQVGRWVKTAGFGGRQLQRELAVKALKDHLWFGTGGWGLRLIGPTYLPSERWPDLQVPGAANVHHDGLQFLSEFGLIGGGLMAAILVTLAVPVIRLRGALLASPLLLFGTLGLLATVIHSWIDLPFRAPAILYTWLMILALLPVAARRREEAVKA
jgi:hypothetical protein